MVNCSSISLNSIEAYGGNGSNVLCGLQYTSPARDGGHSIHLTNSSDISVQSSILIGGKGGVTNIFDPHCSQYIAKNGYSIWAINNSEINIYGALSPLTIFKDSSSFVNIGVNHAPRITSVPDIIAYRDSLYIYQVMAEDVDGDSMTYKLAVAPSWMRINSVTGLVQGLPTQNNLGDTTVAVRVTDRKGSYVSQTFRLSVVIVNHAPRIISLPDTVAYRNFPYTYQIIADDVDGGSITYRLVVAPSWMRINSLSGLVQGLPTQNNLGDTTVSVIAEDNRRTSSVQTFALKVLDEMDPNGPRLFSLAQNHPNPIVSSTTIQYSLAPDGIVNLQIYNILGQEVASLVAEQKPAGQHEITWTPRSLPNGIYIYRLSAAGLVRTRKLLILK